MRRRLFWLIAGCLGIVALAAVAVVQFRKHRSRPANLVVITLDTTRADRLGCYGYKQALTPALDRLAREGVVFDAAYAPAPITLTSHASLFTGLYPPEHGLRTNGRGKLDPSIATLSSVLADAGYECGAFVGSFVLDSKFGLDRGYAVYDDDIQGTGDEEDAAHRERPGANVVSAALAWLKRPRQTPFYCWIHLYDPHFPYQSHPQEFDQRFRENPYDAEIAYVDRQISRVLKSLQSSGLSKDTLVVVAGDHGEGLGDHIEQQHGYTLYNSTQHVPLIVHWPGRLSAGHRHRGPVSLVDVFPTICGLLGQSVPTDISGRDLGPAVLGKPVPARECYAATDDPLLQEGWSPLRSLTDERWKYIRTRKPELFDLLDDPRERDNLAGKNPQQLAKMERRLAEIEQQMTVRTAAEVQLSDRERRTLQSLGYLGGGGSDAVPSPGEELIDVKDMLAFDVEARAAFELVHRGRLDEAVSRLIQVVQHAPAHAASRFFLGQAYEALQKPEEAISAYEDVLKVKPDHIDALAKLGQLYGMIGQFDRAITHLDQAVQISPDSATVRANLGRVLLYQGKSEEAAGHLEEALRLDPELVEARIPLCEALRQAGRGDDAIPVLSAILREDPRSVPARLNLAAILADDHPEDAWQWLSEARSLQPRNPHIHFQMGEFLLAHGKADDAVVCFQETRRLMPNHPGVAAALERAGGQTKN